MSDFLEWLNIESEYDLPILNDPREDVLREITPDLVKQDVLSSWEKHRDEFGNPALSVQLILNENNSWMVLSPENERFVCDLLIDLLEPISFDTELKNKTIESLKKENKLTNSLKSMVISK